MTELHGGLLQGEIEAAMAHGFTCVSLDIALRS